MRGAYDDTLFGGGGGLPIASEPMPQMDPTQAAQLSAMSHIGGGGLAPPEQMGAGATPTEQFVAPKLSPLVLLQRGLMSGESPERVQQLYVDATLGGKIDKDAADYVMQNTNARQTNAAPALEFGAERGGARPTPRDLNADSAVGPGLEFGAERGNLPNQGKATKTPKAGGAGGASSPKEVAAATFEKRKRLLAGLLQEDQRRAVMDRYNELASTGRIDPAAEKRRRTLLLGKGMAGAFATGSAAGGFRGGRVAQEAIERGWQGAEAEFDRPWNLAQEQMDADYKHLGRDRAYANILKSTTEEDWVDPETGEATDFPDLAKQEASIAWMKENAPSLFAEYQRKVRSTELGNAAKEAQIANTRSSIKHRGQRASSNKTLADMTPSQRESAIAREASAIQRKNKDMSREEARAQAEQLLGGKSGRFGDAPKVELPPLFGATDNRQRK